MCVGRHHAFGLRAAATPLGLRAAATPFLLFWQHALTISLLLVADPHEKETLLPPLMGLQVRGTSVDGGTLVVQSRLSLNMASLVRAGRLDSSPLRRSASSAARATGVGSRPL